MHPFFESKPKTSEQQPLSHVEVEDSADSKSCMCSACMPVIIP